MMYTFEIHVEYITITGVLYGENWISKHILKKTLSNGLR